MTSENLKTKLGGNLGVWGFGTGHTFLVSLTLLHTHTQNPAYGRQSISRPMRIVALIPQKGGPRIPQTRFFWKMEKIIQNAKTQQRLKIFQN